MMDFRIFSLCTVKIIRKINQFYIYLFIFKNSITKNGINEIKNKA